ncbi:MAG: hypothetical protein JSS62_04785 [Verrucomicrobia bacterium]|nr:hypothetical protein [Verrucomicrobiota bacterium]MBS0646765.1 hypothetical protein [Verrucomicrobiota bacterium]
MLNLSKEKLVISLQRLTLYLSLAENGPVAQKRDIQKIHSYAGELLADLLAGTVSIEEGLEKYQEMVSHVNSLLTAPVYPKLNTRSVAHLLRSDVIAFENYLLQQMLVGHISVQEERKLFDMAAEIWTAANQNVINDLFPKYLKVVQLANSKVKQEHCYPLPSLEEYSGS